MVPRKRFPAFIKPYYPPNSKKSLKLPPPFTSFVKEILPIKAVVLLKDYYSGNFWAVELAKIGSELFFQAGWTKFLEDNSLEFGDSLVFQYTGSDEFRFKILRATAENRDISGAMDFHSNGGLPEDEDEEEALQEDTGNDNKNTPEGGEEVVEKLEEENLIKNLGKRKCKNSGAKLVKTSTFSAAMGKDAVEGLKIVAQGKAIAVKSKDQDFRSNVQNPFHGLQNPYFIVKYRKYKSNEVYVPQDFVHSFRAQLLPEMIICDPSGRKWSTKFIVRKDKAMWMQGWARLALHNNVREEDSLACELVPRRNRQRSYIQLHIHRMT